MRESDNEWTVRLTEWQSRVEETPRRIVSKAELEYTKTKCENWKKTFSYNGQVVTAKNGNDEQYLKFCVLLLAFT